MAVNRAASASFPGVAIGHHLPDLTGPFAHAWNSPPPSIVEGDVRGGAVAATTWFAGHADGFNE
jgi:hypothetical protein